MSEQFVKLSKLFEDSKGRFLLVLLTQPSDTRFEKLNFSLTDGSDVWKASTTFEECCGSLNGKYDENMKHLRKRMSSSRLQYLYDELSVLFVPPGKTYELKLLKSVSASVAVERLNLMISIADSRDMVAQSDQESPLHLASSRRKAKAQPIADKQGMSLVNPRSKKIPKVKGIEFE